jgi:hypothetical protein
MPFPRKFKSLLELELTDLDKPDYAWITYVVCACSKKACGWGGWILEALYQDAPELRQTTRQDKLLNAPYRDRCPRCRRVLFRTVSLRFEPSANQVPPWGRPGIDYQAASIQYEDD